MNTKKELLMSNLCEFDREEIVAGLQAAMVYAGYDDIRAEYDKETKTVCLTQYGTWWKPINKQWIFTNMETAVEFFDKLFYSWINMSTSTTVEDDDFERKESIDNLLFYMLESGYSDIKIECGKDILVLSNQKGNKINIELSTFPDTRELLKISYLILRSLAGY